MPIKSITLFAAICAVSAVMVFGKDSTVTKQKEYTKKTEITISNEINTVELYISESLQEIAEILKTKGYIIDKKSFVMNFHDKTIVLDNKKLPDDLSRELFQLYTDSLSVNIPEGLDVKLTNIKKETEENLTRLKKDKEQIKQEKNQFSHDIEQFKKDTELFEIEKMKLKKEQERLGKALKLISEELTKNGYQITGKPFSMKFKYLWHMQFENTAYLDKKKLPKDLTNKIFEIFEDHCGKAIRFELPQGLDDQIKELEIITK